MLTFLSSSLFRSFDWRFNVLSGSHDNCAKFVRFSLKVANVLLANHSGIHEHVDPKSRLICLFERGAQFGNKFCARSRSLSCSIVSSGG